MSRMSNCSRFALLCTLFGAAALSACTTEEADVEEEDQAGATAEELAVGVPVMLDGVLVSAADLAAKHVGPLHYVSTYESIRDGYVLAFRDSGAADSFRAGYPVAKRKTEANLFPRTHSKFYDLTGYGDKLLELGVGESAVDLSTHPCACNNDISSLKASETGLWTKVYDLPNLSGDTWSIPSGAEISDLSNYFHNGFTWNQDISSIRVTN